MPACIEEMKCGLSATNSKYRPEFESPVNKADDYYRWRRTCYRAVALAIANSSLCYHWRLRFTGTDAAARIRNARMLTRYRGLLALAAVARARCGDFDDAY